VIEKLKWHPHEWFALVYATWRLISNSGVFTPFDVGTVKHSSGRASMILQQSWLNSYCAEKKAEEVYRYQRSEGRVASCAGDASAGEARGEQEARKKRQAQTEPEQAAGGC
jgi:hypothetical protein